MTKKEREKIREIVTSIDKLPAEINKDFIEALIGISLLSLENGYVLFKRRIGDGLIKEPNKYLEIVSYYSFNELKDEIQNFSKGLDLNNLSEISLKRIVLPILLSETYAEKWDFFLKFWADWFNDGKTYNMLTKEEKITYGQDFVKFILRYNSTLRSRNVSRIMQDIYNVMMDVGLISLVYRNFLDTDATGRRKLLNAILQLKGYRNIAETIGRLLYSHANVLKVTKEQKDLINICRIPIELRGIEKETLDKLKRRANLPTDLNIYLTLAEYIVRNIVHDNDEHAYYNCVRAEVQQSFATLTFKIRAEETLSPIPVKPRYVKIGKLEKIDKEYKGRTRLLEYITQPSDIEIPYYHERLKYDNYAVIATDEIRGEPFSKVFNECRENDCIEDCKRYVDSLFKSLYKVYEATGRCILEPISKYYDIHEALLSPHIKDMLNEHRELRKCLVHGDLHGDNFMVYTECGRAKIILLDFGNVGESHYLKDFIKLEVYIRTKLLGRTLNINNIDNNKNIINQWLELEDFLNDPSRDADNLPYEHRKFIEVIKTIREKARELSTQWGIDDKEFKKEYTLCLIAQLSAEIGYLERDRKRAEEENKEEDARFFELKREYLMQLLNKQQERLLGK